MARIFSIDTVKKLTLAACCGCASIGLFSGCGSESPSQAKPSSKPNATKEDMDKYEREEFDKSLKTVEADPNLSPEEKTKKKELMQKTFDDRMKKRAAG